MNRYLQTNPVLPEVVDKPEWSAMGRKDFFFKQSGAFTFHVNLNINRWQGHIKVHTQGGSHILTKIREFDTKGEAQAYCEDSMKQLTKKAVELIDE